MRIPKITLAAALAWTVLMPVAGHGEAAPTTVIKVTLDDSSSDAKLTGMAIRLEKDTIKAGQVLFDVTNRSLYTDHEMIVIPVADASKPLPYDRKKKRLLEHKMPSLGEVSGLSPGGHGTLAVTLSPGHYILACNIKGHYMDGMSVHLTVTP